MKHASFIIVLALLVAVGIWFFTTEDTAAPVVPDVVTSFEECVAAGNAVMESYPRQCRANGETFVEYIGNELEKRDLIRVDTPRPNQVILSPLAISGEAVGPWFFEADFPVRLFDADGNELAVAIATAQGEWMTTEFVPFTATLEFEAPASDTGTLEFQKDNPSDLRELDDALVMPVRFR